MKNYWWNMYKKVDALIGGMKTLNSEEEST